MTVGPRESPRVVFFHRYGFGLGINFIPTIGGKLPMPWLLAIDLGFWQWNFRGKERAAGQSGAE